MAATVPGTERRVNLRVIEVSEETDLCLLEALPAASGLTIAGSFNLNSKLYVLGHPFLKPLTVTDGYIVARELVRIAEQERPIEHCKGPSRAPETFDGWFGPETVCVRSIDAWDTSVIIYPGNSGSPVFNSSGEVVAVAFASDQRTARGALIPLDKLKAFISIY